MDLGFKKFKVLGEVVKGSPSDNKRQKVNLAVSPRFNMMFLMRRTSQCSFGLILTSSINFCKTNHSLEIML